MHKNKYMYYVHSAYLSHLAYTQWQHHVGEYIPWCPPFFYSLAVTPVLQYTLPGCNVSVWIGHSPVHLLEAFREEKNQLLVARL